MSAVIPAGEIRLPVTPVVAPSVKMLLTMDGRIIYVPMEQNK